MLQVEADTKAGGNLSAPRNNVDCELPRNEDSDLR